MNHSLMLSSMPMIGNHTDAFRQALTYTQTAEKYSLTSMNYSTFAVFTHLLIQNKSIRVKAARRHRLCN